MRLISDEECPICPQGADEQSQLEDDVIARNQRRHASTRSRVIRRRDKDSEVVALGCVDEGPESERRKGEDVLVPARYFARSQLLELALQVPSCFQTLRR